MHTTIRIWERLAVSCSLLGILMMVPAIGKTEGEPPPQVASARDYDRFDIRLGGGWVFGANTTASLSRPSGFGTVVDYDETLNGETSNSTFRFDGIWHINRKHGLSYTWYDVNRTGVRRIDRSIDFGDQTYGAGAQLDTQIDIRLNRLLYRYSMVKTDQINFDIGGGIYYGKIKMTVTADGTITRTAADGSQTTTTGIASQSTTLAAPLPTAGINVECKLSPRWGTFFSADWFYFAYGDWEGAQSDLNIGLTYKLAKRWTLGVGYDRFTLDLKGPAGDNTFKITNAWNSLFSYLSFHW